MKTSSVLRVIAIVLAASGCQVVIGLSDYKQGDNGGSALSNGLQPPQSVGPPSGGAGCSGWMQTGQCLASGPLEPMNDQACNVPILGTWSGYCVCSNGTQVGTDCTHVEASCDQVCAAGSWSAALSTDGGIGVDAGPSCGSGDCLGNDGNCYSCQVGTCSTAYEGMCSSANAGVYCCEPLQPEGGSTCPILGCFTDRGDSNDTGGRDLSGAMLFDGQPMSIERCQQFCNGYSYYGVENGNQCFCGSSINNNPSMSSNCGTQCSGNNSETCGGVWAIDIYGPCATGGGSSSSSGSSSGGVSSGSSGSSSGGGSTCVAPGGTCTTTGECCQSGSYAPNGSVCVTNDNACHALCSTSSQCTGGCCIQLSSSFNGFPGDCGQQMSGYTCL